MNNLIAIENWVKNGIFDAARITGKPISYGKVNKEVSFCNEILHVTIDITEEEFVTFNRKKDENISFACAFT